MLSQPADTLLSKVSTTSLAYDLSCSDRRFSQINQGQGGKGGMLARLGALAKEAGPAGLFVGLGPRMVRLLSAFDYWI